MAPRRAAAPPSSAAVALAALASECAPSAGPPSPATRLPLAADVGFHSIQLEDAIAAIHNATGRDSGPDVSDSIDVAGHIVGNIECAIGTYDRIDWPAGSCALSEVEKSPPQILPARGTPADHFIAARLIAIPRAVKADESVVQVRCGKLRAGVKRNSQRRGMGLHLLLRP